MTSAFAVNTTVFDTSAESSTNTSASRLSNGHYFFWIAVRGEKQLLISCLCLSLYFTIHITYEITDYFVTVLRVLCDCLSHCASFYQRRSLFLFPSCLGHSGLLRCCAATGVNLSARGTAGLTCLRLKTFLVVTMLCVSLPSTYAAPVTVDLTTFTSGTDGGRLIGTYSSLTGITVAQIGDHNGDGFNDFICGSQALKRAIIVMKGNATYAEMSAPSIVSDMFFRVIKQAVGSSLGSSVGGIGDINDDGFDDAIVGAGAGAVPNRNSAGYAFVLFGARGPFTDISVSADYSASSTGFMILGVSPSTMFVTLNDHARGLGDVNGDGVDDFAVSARWSVGTSAKTQNGVVWVIFGRKSLAFDTIDLLPANFGSNGVYFMGAFSSDNLGQSIRPAGDFNGDGIADFLMGATGYDPPAVNGVARNEAGAVYLMHGSATGLATMDLSTFVTGTMGVRFLGAVSADSLGRSVSGVGDVNGDGIDDIGIGANAADPLTRSSGGIVYVIYGTKVAFTTDFDLLNFVASPLGFAIYGSVSAPQLCTVAPAGDINRDGVNDILVGGITVNSRAHVIFGQRAARTAPVDTIVDDVITFYYSDLAFLGIAVDGGQDLTGDGIPDLLLGASTATVTPVGGSTALTNAGAAWMISGFSLFPHATLPPTTAPTSGESAAPSATPTLAPSNLPSALPSVEPSMDPSRVPSVLPSAMPSVQPSTAPTSDESPVPSVDPTITPSSDPSAPPTAAPSLVPSVAPTANPTACPSATPTVTPSVQPTALPTFSPTTTPTSGPSMNPSVTPTLGPTRTPTLAPSLTPSVDPTTNPTVVPTVAPTSAPSLRPSANPTAGPTQMPTAIPSGKPTVDPSAAPSATPTTVPSMSPTLKPTATPTLLPTLVPSKTPTVKPTVPADKDYEVAVNVEQEVFLVTKDDYDAQKAAYNRTIQHTVADAADGITPERVTEIVVEEEEEEGRVGTGVLAGALSTSSVRLQYRVTVHDPDVTVEMLRAQLVQAAQEGRMDTALRTYAAQFGAIGLNNGTFGLPQVTSADPQRDASEQLTGVEIALVVVGATIGLVLLAFIACCARFQKPVRPLPLPHSDGNCEGQVV